MHLVSGIGNILVANRVVGGNCAPGGVIFLRQRMSSMKIVLFE